MTTFLGTCLKLLRDDWVVRGLHEVINKRIGWGELRAVKKIGRHASWTSREMRLTVKIGDYEMDQVILDLGSDANVLPKQTWEHIGKPTLQSSPIQLWLANQ